MADFLLTSINTNGYGTITIPSIEDGYYGMQELHTAYQKGISETATVLDLQTLYKQLSLDPDVGWAIDKLYTPTSSEDMETDEYQEALAFAKAHLRFIWGSFDAGGLYARIVNNELSFGILNGFFQFTEGVNVGKFRYNFADDQSPVYRLSLTECKAVAICFGNASSTDTNYPRFSIQYRQDLSTIEVKTINTNNVLTATYEPLSQNAPLEVAMNNYLWTDDFSFEFQVPPFEFNYMPVQVWNGTGEFLITQSAPTGAIKIRGSWDGGAIVPDESAGGNAGTGGGDGDFSNRNTPYTGENPTGGIDACNSGLITLYNPTQAQVKAFNNFLFGGSITDAIANQLKRLISNPYDYLIFLALCHFNPPTDQLVGETIKFVGIDSLVGSRKINQQIVEIGPYKIGYYPSFNSFLDYSPFTKVRLYAPYIGFQELNIDDLTGTKNVMVTLTLTYYVDLLTGSCVAKLVISRGKRINGANADDSLNNFMYTWNGNVYQMLPLSSNDFRGLFTAVTQFANGVGSVVNGNAVGGLGAMASAVMSQKSTVNKNVPSASSYGYMSPQEPFLQFEIPIQSLPSYDSSNNYSSYHGYPSNIQNKVSYFSGYLETDENTIWKGDIDCLDGEIEEIQTLFNTGVYV